MRHFIVCVCVCVFICHSVILSVSLCVSVSLSLCLSVCLSVSLSLSLSLALSLSLNPHNVHPSSDLLEELDREGHLLSRLRHPNLLLFMSMAIDEHRRPMWLVTEVTNGSLSSLARRLGRLQAATLARLAVHLFRALAYLHSQGVVHRDVKPDNLLWCGAHDDGTPMERALTFKLADVGLARYMHGARAATLVGTPFFMAPEILTPPYTSKVDVFSAGMLLADVTTSMVFHARDHGLAGSGGSADRTAVLEAAVKQLKDSGWHAMATVVRRCTSVAANDRPTALEALALVEAAGAGPVHTPVRLKSTHGRYLALGADGSSMEQSSDGRDDRTTFTIAPLVWHGDRLAAVTLQANNGKYVTLNRKGEVGLTADGAGALAGNRKGHDGAYWAYPATAFHLVHWPTRAAHQGVAIVSATSGYALRANLDGGVAKSRWVCGWESWDLVSDTPLAVLSVSLQASPPALRRPPLRLRLRSHHGRQLGLSADGSALEQKAPGAAAGSGGPAGAAGPDPATEFSVALLDAADRSVGAVTLRASNGKYLAVREEGVGLTNTTAPDADGYYSPAALALVPSGTGCLGVYSVSCGRFVSASDAGGSWALSAVCHCDGWEQWHVDVAPPCT